MIIYCRAYIHVYLLGILIMYANTARMSLVICVITGEHMTDDFAKINPFQLVPAIDDNGFKLTERFVVNLFWCISRIVPEPNCSVQPIRIDSQMLGP